MFNTPILLIVFNRPDTTQQVFNKIREQKPAKLYITSDGPRLNNETDKLKCDQVKEIVNIIDWPCDVKHLYAEENLGFSRRIKSALEWFFENEEMGIILEDDCLPSDSFFEFCAKTLERHKDSESMLLITGSNFCDKPISKDSDYFIADFGYIWGWASWRRAIQSVRWHENYTLDQIYAKLKEVYCDEAYIQHFFAIIKGTYNVRDCWDVELFVYNLMTNKSNVFPNVNLVSNIGNTGTHYKDSQNKLLNTRTFSINFDRFDVNNFKVLTVRQKKWIIKQFNEKVNPLSMRDRIYLVKNMVLSKLKYHYRSR